MSYSVVDYVAMIGDEHRTGPYVRALRKMVTPESVVLDLGAGFGFFAVLAATLGAKHAFAIETDEAIGLGPALARANGVGDRVTFYRGDSRQVTLPERANLLVEDLRGMTPFHLERLAVLRDARERLLTGDARYVALRDRIWAAAMRHSADQLGDLETTGADTWGVDLRSVRGHVVDGWRRVRSTPEELLLGGGLLGTLELATVSDPHFEGTTHWTPDAALVVDGFLVWFDAELSEGECFSTAPGPGQTVHGCLRLPLRDPLPVPARAELALRFCAFPAAGDYAWTWECSVSDANGGAVVRTPRQSTLGALALSRPRLAAMSECHRPSLGIEGRRWRDAIALTDGERTTGEIARALSTAADLEFRSETEAFDWLQRALPVLETGGAEKL